LTILLAAAGAAWYVAGPPPESGEPAAVEVPATDTSRQRPAVGASIIVTLRWGQTDRLEPTTRAAESDVNWDGFLALDCGQIHKVEPLSFELDDDDEPVKPDAATDFVGPVIRGDQGDQRVYWRSQTHTSWDGLRVQLVACDPTGHTSATGSQVTSARPTSILHVHTAQRTYTARLDWSANDFVALATERPGHKLEVYINAEYDERSMRGARITRLEEAEYPSSGPVR